MTDFGSFAERFDARRLGGGAALVVLLLITACTSEKEPTAAPGAMERYADQHDNDQAEERKTAIKEAEARGVARVAADMKADDAREKDRTEANR